MNTFLEGEFERSDDESECNEDFPYDVTICTI